MTIGLPAGAVGSAGENLWSLSVRLSFVRTRPQWREGRLVRRRSRGRGSPLKPPACLSLLIFRVAARTQPRTSDCPAGAGVRKIKAKVFARRMRRSGSIEPPRAPCGVQGLRYAVRQLTLGPSSQRRALKIEMISIWNHFNLSCGGYSAGPARQGQRVADERCAAVSGEFSGPRGQPPALRRLSAHANGCLSREFVCLNTRNPLRRGAIRTNSDLAQYARACGRVSVGGDLDKRPVNRPWKTGSRRRTGEPRQTGDAT